MNKRLLPTLLVSALLISSACSDDGDDTKKGGQTTTLGAAADGKIGNSDPDAVIDSLNSAEWKAACVDIAEATDARGLKHGPCILSGILATIIGQSCSEVYDLCTRSESNIDCDSKPTSCPVTLREADACITSNLVWFKEQTDGLTCKSSLNDVLKIDQNHESKECETVKMRCPELIPQDNQDSTSFEWEG